MNPLLPLLAIFGLGCSSESQEKDTPSIPYSSWSGWAPFMGTSQEELESSPPVDLAKEIRNVDIYIHDHGKQGTLDKEDRISVVSRNAFGELVRTETFKLKDYFEKFQIPTLRTLTMYDKLWMLRARPGPNPIDMNLSFQRGWFSESSNPTISTEELQKVLLTNSIGKIPAFEYGLRKVFLGSFLGSELEETCLKNEKGERHNVLQNVFYGLAGRPIKLVIHQEAHRSAAMEYIRESDVGESRVEIVVDPNRTPDNHRIVAENPEIFFSPDGAGYYYPESCEGRGMVFEFGP